MIKIEGRSLKIPTQERIIGWVGDNRVEVRIFELNRFYGDIDLSEFDFKLDTEINGTKNIIDLDKSVTEDKITLTWTVKESHILNPGHMSIQIRAFSAGEEKWHSAQGYVRVQPSINATQVLPDPLPSEFVQMEQRVTAMHNEAITAAQTATEQADRVQDIVDYAETEVLPALNQAVEDAGLAKGLLDGSIEDAGTAKTQLDGSISSAGTAKGELDGSINEANTAKGQLDDSIDLAGNAKTELDGSITAAGQAKELLDESIATGDLVAFRYDFESHLNDYVTYKDSNNLKVAKVEKELNDYKATMQQINIHQRPTQKATGHGIISLPPNAAEGQISVVVKGGTYTNLLGDAGDFESANLGWTFHYLNGTGYSASSSEKSVVGTKSFKGVLTETTRAVRVEKNGVITQNHKYYVSAYIFPKYSEPAYFQLGGIDGSYIFPIPNQWNRISSIIDCTNKTHEYFRLYHRADKQYAVGDTIYFDGIMIVDLTAHGLENKTKEELDKMFAHYFNGTKSTISAFRIRSVSEDETQESSAYVIAIDADTGEILELRSLPNGVKDEIDITRGKLIRRTGKAVLNGNEDWRHDATGDLTSRFYLNNWKDANNAVNISPNGDNAVELNDDAPYILREHAGGDVRCLVIHVDGNLYLRVEKNKLDSFSGTVVEKLRTYLNQYPITLTYQLAEPVEIPIQVSGSIVSYPSGTIYIERILPDAGVYTDKITILHQDAPIKRLDRLSKVDFYTGVETELDVSEAVIAEDKLSFTHPDLSEGDIVFFEYEYDVESTEGETEVEYYDSRYVIKDSVTDKFYKWNIVVANGQPSIELVEV